MNLRDFGWKSFILLAGLYLAVAAGGLLLWQTVPWAELTAGVSLAYNNLWLAVLLIRWGLFRSLRSFMGAVFGGMILRILLHFSLMFILIGSFEFEAIPLFASFIFAYFFFLAFEVYFLHRAATALEGKQ